MPAQPARSKVLEEAGLDLQDPQFAYAVNSVFPSGAHYVTVFVRAQVPADVRPLNCEPHKCEGWDWVRRRCCWRVGRQQRGVAGRSEGRADAPC